MNNANTPSTPQGVTAHVNSAVAYGNNSTAVYNEHFYELPPPERPVLKNPPIAALPYYIPTASETKMHEQLKAQTTPIKRLAIFGTAGSGKTELAKQYLRAYQQEAPHTERLTYLLLAETTEQWWQSLRDWAEVLHPRFNETLKAEPDIKKQQQLIIQALQKSMTETPWCIVIDNWDNPPISELEMLFNVGQGTWLLTTQHKSPFLKVDSLDLSQGLTAGESTLLLNKIIAPLGDLSVLGSEIERNALSSTLNHLPLALVQAGSYLLWENTERAERGDVAFKYRDYEALLKKAITDIFHIQKSLLHDKTDVPRDSTWMSLKTQEAAIDLSLQKATQWNTPTPQSHLWQMLCFCGFLASDAIPQQLLKDYLGQLTPDKTEAHLSSYFHETLKAAQRYSLLQFEDKRSDVDNGFSLHMHRVIQHVLRDLYWPRLLGKTGHDATTIRHFMRESLQVRFSSAVENQTFALIRAYLPHVSAWSFYWKKAFLSQDEIALYSNWACAHFHLGDERMAKALHQDILMAKTTHYGTEAHVSVAETQQNLANTLEYLGDYNAARTLCEKALVTKIAHYGTEAHVSVAAVQQNLAGILAHLGDYNAAHTLYEKALANKIAYYGTEIHVSVAGTQQNLANTLEYLGDYNAARTLYEKALVTKIAHYGTEAHVSVAATQQNLAGSLARLGDYNAARTLCEKALSTQIAHYGTEGHVSVAETQFNLALLLVRSDKKRALSLFKTCEHTFKTTVGGQRYVARCQQEIKTLVNDIKRLSESTSSPLLFTFKQDIHTVFGQGYRFSAQRCDDNKEALTICVDSYPTSQESHLALEALQDKVIQSVSNHSENFSVKYDKENHQYLMKGSLPVISQLNHELQLIEEAYEQETGQIGCALS